MNRKEGKHWRSEAMIGDVDAHENEQGRFVSQTSCWTSFVPPTSSQTTRAKIQLWVGNWSPRTWSRDSLSFLVVSRELMTSLSGENMSSWVTSVFNSKKKAIFTHIHSPTTQITDTLRSLWRFNDGEILRFCLVWLCCLEPVDGSSTLK